jgi:SAM-dependent methyltransferase
VRLSAAAPVLNRLPPRLAAPLWRAGWRATEWVRARRRRPGDDDAVARIRGADRWPLPPPELRVMVTGRPHAAFFLRRGRAHAGLLRSMLSDAGARPGELGPVLDFGCGCGRIARWLDGVGWELHGCDPNPKLVRWCQESLPFMEVRQSSVEPPLPYADQTFDLVYAHSIFTHIPAALQRPWIDELRRVLRPGGVVWFTVSSEVESLSAAERSEFDAGRPVVRFEEGIGTNLCFVRHPPSYVQGELLAGLELLAARDAASQSRALRSVRLAQDAYLARRPA